MRAVVAGWAGAMATAGPSSRSNSALPERGQAKGLQGKAEAPLVHGRRPEGCSGLKAVHA